ncbi:MBL fold metallo-hydrolase [Roseateles koreensis]|uniref:MBL fold metallo-hydrolase n=1 Tax=Roseateles koreensis TaxID=2987526 RepID=A0ABT5KRZ6_9BURK|nr:MBL fold metallo-hydrolase [Roseateles koreensis]MDC8784552.1 MBL fold metallo-hydrolase [Roseateles koreensis]
MSPFALPADVTVLERGWLSSNSVILFDEHQGAVLVDTGYHSHQAQTAALVQQALSAHAHTSPALRLIVNTHLHSDHCGGNAKLSQQFNCPIAIPPGEFDAAARWDEAALSYADSGQHCPRFTPSYALTPGEEIVQGHRRWQVHAAPGHDPHSVVLFEPDSGILISADALWQHGFGIVFPAIEGGAGVDRGFAEVEATLDLITTLPVRYVIPGHGSPFSDVEGAMRTARQRLTYFRQNPSRHASHAAKALIMFRLLDVGAQSAAQFLGGLDNTPVHCALWRGHFSHQPLRQWSESLLAELAQNGQLALNDAQLSVPPQR